MRNMIGGKFAPLTVRNDEDADIDSMITTFNTAVTETANVFLCKHHQKKETWQTDTEDDHHLLHKEGEAAVQSLKEGKSAKVDNIPAKVVQADGEEIIMAVMTLCNKT